MYIPPLFNAAEVMHGADLDRKNTCLCSKMVRVGDTLLTWTHETGKDEYGWFCVCNHACYCARITEGTRQ